MAVTDADSLPVILGLLGRGSGIAGTAVIAVYILNKLWESVKADRRENTTADTVASASRDLIDGMREELMAARDKMRLQDEMIETLRLDKLNLTIQLSTLQNEIARYEKPSIGP